MGELKWNLRKKVKLVMKILYWNASEKGLVCYFRGDGSWEPWPQDGNLKAHKPRK